MTMEPRSYPKQPWAVANIPINCTNRLPTGVTVSSATAAMFDSDGNDVSSTMIEGSPTVSSPYVYVQIKAGTDGENYSLRVRVTLTNGEKDEDELIIYVRET